MDYSIEIIDIEFLGYSNVLEYVVDTDEYKVCESTVKYNHDGTVSHIEINDNIFAAKDPNIRKIMKEEMKKYIGKIVMSKSLNIAIHIEKDVPKEYAYSVSSKVYNKNTLKDKGNMITGIVDILENANHIYSSNNRKRKHIKDAPNGFAYYKVLVKMNNLKNPIFYSVRVVNRIDVDGNECFYDIDNLTVIP